MAGFLDNGLQFDASPTGRGLPASATELPASALAALAGAFKSGLLNVEDVQQAAATPATVRAKIAAADDLTSQARSNIQIRPLKTEAERENLIQQIKTLPLAGELERGKIKALGNDLAFSEGTRARRQALTESELTRAERGTFTRKVIQQLDPTGEMQLEPAVDFWEKNNLGPIPVAYPKDENGQEIKPDRLDPNNPNYGKVIDLPTFWAKVAAVQDRLTAGTSPSADRLALEKEVLERGGDLVNSDGTEYSTLDLKRQLAKLPKLPLTGQQVSDLDTTRRNAQATLTKLVEAAGILRGPHNVVGPVVGQRWNPYLWLRALVGDSAPLIAQQKLTMLSNQLTAEATQMLKGAISQKEMALMRASVPQTPYDESIWLDSLNEKFKILKEVTEKGITADALRERGATPDSALGIPPSFPGGPSSAEISSLRPSPAKGAPGSEDNPLPGGTVGDFAKVPAGSWFIDAHGRKARK